MFMHSRSGGIIVHEPYKFLVDYKTPVSRVTRTKTGAWIVRGGGPRRRYRTKLLAFREQARRERALDYRRP